MIINMKIKVTSDSTCDLSEQIIKKYDIDIISLKVNKGGIEYEDGVDIKPSDIFEHVNNGGELCSTAAINVDRYINFFEKYSKEYDAVIHINIGASFSSCHQNACIAASEFNNVYPIDSKNLSTGQGHIVLKACEESKTCTDINALCEYLRALTDKVEASFILDRLDYMVKGGRCSMVAALGANLLKLKPCIEVIGGKMQVVKKYRGAYGKCLTQYITDRLENRDDVEKDRIFLTYTPISDDDLKIARELTSSKGGFSEILETTAGCTISCHCGPGTLGVLYIRK